jgi:DNA-directed RNA polymerase specialized sigma subunit
LRIEGYVSKKNIRRLLDNYQALEKGDQLPSDAPVNAGQKAYDGVSGGRLNKIMLDDAIAQLSPFMATIVKCRWTRQLQRRDTLKMLGISAGVYYQRCNLAVEQIYVEVNGKAAGIVALYAAINNGG